MKFRFIALLLVPLVSTGAAGRVTAEPSVSSTLLFMKSRTGALSVEKTAGADDRAAVTIRFDGEPSSALIADLEHHGVEFSRWNGALLHTRTIYPATVHLDSLDTLEQYDEILRIEGTLRPAAAPTLNVSNPQVQAMQTWSSKTLDGEYIDGSGVIVTNVDTGIDIYHPAFFRPDNGVYDWIDANGNGQFDNGEDYVDLDADGVADPLEVLRYFDASFTDQNGYDLIEYTDGVYEADLDWLYNDQNRDTRRNYGNSNGFTENSPCFGELLFLTDDVNANNRLDPGEHLIGLGSSRIRAIYDEKGPHYRGDNLLTSVSDSGDHGTPASGIVGGQVPGRRLAGMAPGVEFIAINRSSLSSAVKKEDNPSEALYNSVETGLLWAREQGSQIMMYEYGSWVYEFLDGSSNMEILIDELYDGDTGHAGVHQFTASGNLAGPTRHKHAFLSLGNSREAHLPFTAPASYNITNLYCSILWYGRLNPPAIQLQQGTSYLTLDHLTPNVNTVYNGTLGGYQITWATEESDSNTVKLDILVSISDDPQNTVKTITGDFLFNMTGKRIAGTDIDVYLADNKSDWMNGAQFTSYIDDDGTVTTPGTADRGVTVGAYDPRGRRNPPAGSFNDFSSWGRTIDGRRAVDIMAPGSDVYSVSSHFAVGGDPGGYLAFGGTSSALPHVVGCAALILQTSPGITPPMLEQVLYGGALEDEFTGATPNDKWGYGKLRVLDALLHADLALSVEAESPIPERFTVSHAYPNPFNHTTSFAIEYGDLAGAPLDVSVYSLSGQLVSRHRITRGYPGAFTFNWDGTASDGRAVSSGLYLFRFSAGNTVVTRRAVFLK